MPEDDEMFDVQGRTELFDGDMGTLPEGARRALVRLIKEPYISAEKNAADWRWVVECRPSIQSALNDLFLGLVIDEHNELAYAAAPDGAADDFPRLKQERKLTDLQSLLVVFLRQQYANQTSSGSGKAWVDAEDIHAHLERLNSGRLDTTRLARAIDTAIDSMKGKHYIEKVDSEERRYRIMPIVESVFSLEKVMALLDEYERDTAAHSLAQDDGETNETLVDDGAASTDVKTEGE